MVSPGSNPLATIIAYSARMCLKERLNSIHNSKTLSPTSKVFYAIDVHHMYIPLLNFRRTSSPKEFEMDSLPKVASSPALSPDVDTTIPHPTSAAPEDASTGSMKFPTTLPRTFEVVDADSTMADDTLSPSGAPEDRSNTDHDITQGVPPGPGEQVPMGSSVVEPFPNPRHANATNIHDIAIDPPQRETAESLPNISATSEETEHLCEEPTMSPQDALDTANIDPLLHTSESSSTRSFLGQDGPQVMGPTSSNDPVPPVTYDTRDPHNTSEMNVDGKIARDKPSPFPPHHDNATSGPPEKRLLKRLPQHHGQATSGLPENGVSFRCVKSILY